MNGKWDMREKKKIIHEGVWDYNSVSDIKGAAPK